MSAERRPGSDAPSGDPPRTAPWPLSRRSPADPAVHQAREGAKLVSLFYMDLDQFKPVNDQLGHDAGDELLIAVGERLRQCTRADDIVARLGGDEFAVLLAAPTLPDVDNVAKRIAEGFRSPFAIAGHDLSLAISIGRADYPTDADDADSLLRTADASMFAHKRARQTRLAFTRVPEAAR